MTELKEPVVGEVVFRASAGDLELAATISKIDDDGAYAVLTVERDSEIVWQSEEANKPEETFAFGLWYDGPALPVLFEDIDGDGKPELLAPISKSDISPPTFRIFRWTGDDMLYLRKRALLAASSGSFVWTTVSPEFVDGSWVDHFEDGKALLVTLQGEDVSHATVDYEGFADGIRLK